MKRLLFVVLIAAFALSACASSGNRSLSSPGFSMQTYEEAPAPPMGGGYNGSPSELEFMTVPGDGMMYEESKAYDATSNMTAQQDRLVIQNAELSIVVDDPKTKMDAIAAMANRLGGFVVNSNIYQSYTESGQTVPEASITVRVPAESLEEALNEIKQGVGEVLTENRSGQDVTQSYTDLRSRLKNLEAAEAQLQEILDDTTDPDAVIEVFNQLVYYREQIELVKGQMQYYEQAAALSAISVRIVAEESIQPLEIGGWKPQGVARDAAQALIRFLQGFADFIIYLVILILPVMVVVLLPLWLVWKGLRRVVRRNKSAKPAPPAPESSDLSKSE